jgi:hypothetical protein
MYSYLPVKKESNLNDAMNLWIVIPSITLAALFVGASATYLMPLMSSSVFKVLIK